MKENNKITSQMRKGVLEYIILSIIENGHVYANEILEILKENSLIVVEGTLYPLLSRLKSEDILSYYWVESQSGPPRKYYSLTQEGKETLQMMKLVWKQLDDTIRNVSKK